MLELAVIDFQEISIILAAAAQVNGQDTPALCQRFYLQYTGHNRVTGEMPQEEPFIERDILDPYNMRIAQFNDLIHQCKRDNDAVMFFQ